MFCMKKLPLIAVTVIATVVAVFAALEVERYTSTTEFCTMCHSMSFPAAEIKGSVHYGPLGTDPECGDCHLPPEFAARMVAHVVSGVRDTYSEIMKDLDTEEKYDAHRAEFARNARMTLKRWDSSPCRACHKDVRPHSGHGKTEHARMASEDLTCIDCHQGIYHKPVPEEKL